MSNATHTENNKALATLKREAQWAATTWHLVCIANYSRTSKYARKEASRFGWGKKARHSVEALAKVYFQYDQSEFLKTIQDHAPTLYGNICLCECHHGIDGPHCDCCNTYSTSCFCHCHFCVHCDTEANKCSGPDECGCDCHENDCCDECQRCCWCQCHNCLDCNSHTGECGDYCDCESHTACDDCSVRHAANDEEDDDDCSCDCHECSDCYNCSFDCDCGCHECCSDCMNCECDCHDCDYCDDDCYDCSCNCHECCEDCKDDHLDDEGTYYQPPANKVERVAERIEEALGVQLSVEETDQIDGARLQAAAYPDRKIKVTRDLANTMTDDELAFIIGHEYAHIEQKHIEKQLASETAKRAALRQGLSQMDDHLKEKGSGRIKRAAAHIVAGALGEASVAITSRIESQHYETKADERALEVTEAAGYDPEASVTAYEKLHGGRVPEVGVIQAVTSTHPAPKSRHDHLKEKSKDRSGKE